jgi:hypothetical protein
MNMTKASTELDNPWKEIIEGYFEQFMIFFFPKIHQQIDWTRGYEFLDKELQKVVREAKMKRRLVDKLAKVSLKNGQETILYIHIEVQGQYEKDFDQRMFIYHYRLFDRYGPRVISLAILGDNSDKWRPKNYAYNLMGCALSFRFPIVKLIDYRKKRKTLEKSKNPFAIVVRIHLKGLDTLRASKKRFQEKVELFKALHEANYSEKEINDLFRFMDWMLALPKGLDQQFNEFYHQYEEEKKMPYVTSVERYGIQLGVLQNAREYVVEALKVRFKRVPKSLADMIQAIEDTKLLSKLLREAILADSLKTFKQQLEKQA